MRLDAADAAITVLGILAQNQVPIGLADRVSRATLVPYEVVIELIRNVAVRDDDPGFWQEDIVLGLLGHYEDEARQNGCRVYVRPIEIGQPEVGRTRGRLSGPEITVIRNEAGPVPALVLLYSGERDKPEAWYPTLVMPAGAPPFVFAI